MGKNLVTAAATAGLLVTAFGATANAQELTYTVHQGDSLWKISNTNHISIDQLKNLNQLNNDQIYVNQKLSLTYTYTVKAGDSLWTIANKYGTTVNNLKQQNGLDSDLIQIGQKLQLSNVNAGAAAATAAPVNVKPSTYVVQKGDTLSEIGVRVQLSVPALKAMNQLNSDTIYPGQTLRLKGVQSVNTQNNVNETSEKAAPASNANIAKNILEKSTAVEAAKTTTPSDANAQAAAPKAPAPAPAPKAKPVQKPSANTNTQVAQRIIAKSTAVEAARTTTPSAPAPAVKPAAPVTTAPAASVQAIINEAEKYIGTPYVWGGNTPSGFDCSGYIKYVFDKFGMSIPRTTDAEWAALKPVSSPSVGDLVFFATYNSGPSHVGIYLGNNQFISAEDNGVKISSLTYDYWKSRYLGARSPF